MKNPRTILFAVLVLIAGLVMWQRYSLRTVDAALKVSSFKVETARVLHAGERGGTRLKFLDGNTLPTEYIWSDKSLARWPAQKAEPLALAAGDFDRDGVPDLVSGYGTADGGILTLHPGNVASIFPNSPEAKSRWGNGEIQPFFPQAAVILTSDKPEFIVTGDFNNDTFLDIVTAERGAYSLHLFPGDGQGSFVPAARIALDGAVTSLTAGDLNRSDGLADLAVGLVGASGPQVVIFENWRGALVPPADRASQPDSPAGSVGADDGPFQDGLPVSDRESIALPQAASAVVVASLGADALNDLAVAAGSELIIIAGRDRKLAGNARPQNARAVIRRQVFDAAIVALTTGSFTGGASDEVVLLTQDGSLHTVQPEGGRTVSRNLHMPVSGNALLAARLSVGGTQDDLLVLDQANREVAVISATPAMTGKSIRWKRVPTFHSRAEIIAALPMRLNKDGIDDIVFLSAPPALALSEPPALAGGSDNASADGRIGPISPIGSISSLLQRSNQPPAAVTLTPPGVALSAPQAIFTVNSTGNEDDATPGNGVCLTSANTCTLLAAIREANAHAGADEIRFNIPGTAPFTIAPLLPTIIDTVTIDATTQPGFSGSPIVELNGAGKGINQMGLEIGSTFGGTSASNSVVRGLVINRFGGDAINLDQVTPIRNVKIEGCYLGTDLTGTIARPNGGGFPQRGAVNISGTGHTIGGTTGAARNVISGNNSNGIRMGNSNPTSGITIQGNFIGTDKNGTADLGNTLDGIKGGGSTNISIGGATAGAGNIISGNGGSGIDTSGGGGGTNCVVEGNRIGTDITGNVDLGNDNRGVRFDGNTDSRIGGTTNAARNMISGNGKDGIELKFSGNISVQGNFIGTKADGATLMANDRHGIFLTNLTGESTIGGGDIGDCDAPCNVIAAGAGGVGVSMTNDFVPNSLTAEVSPTIKSGDAIGFAKSGDQPRLGVAQAAPTPQSGEGIKITQNSYFIDSQTRFVIDLGNDGPTKDDVNDKDKGVNGVQNTGEFLKITQNGDNLNVQWNINTEKDSSYVVDMYMAKPNGLLNGLAKRIGSQNVNSDSFGDASFNKSFSVSAPAGSVVFVVTTNTTTNNSSESSAFRSIGTGPTPSPSPSPSDCTFKVEPKSFDVLSEASPTNFVEISTESECKWSAASNSPFITNVFPVQGSGKATVRFSVLGNVNEISRRGTLTIAGETVTVNQVGCGYFFIGGTIVFPAAFGGTQIFRVGTTGSECKWTITGGENFEINPSGGTGGTNVAITPKFQNTSGQTTATVLSLNDVGKMPIIQLPKNVNNDFDGDNKADIARVGKGPNTPESPQIIGGLVQQSNSLALANGPEPGAQLQWVINSSANGSERVAQFGLDTDNIAPGDYNGDGTSDLAVWRPANGTWFIARPTGIPAKNFDAIQFGLSSDIPVQADYDADGKTDIAVFRPSGGDWRILQSSDNQVRVVHLGSVTDKLVPGDYDGDGSVDVAVWRPSNQTWEIIQSSDNSTRLVKFGAGDDIPAPGDYDGDFITDLAVFRPSDGTWRILRSSDNSVLEVKLGLAGDVLVPADYDGDLKTDVAVFRPSDGTWRILRSSDGTEQTQQFGQRGDVPIPSALFPQPTWQAVGLNAGEPEIKTWKLDGHTFAYVKLTFPNGGFRVADFGSTVRSGSDFSSDAAVERFTGPSVQAITTTAQIYDLGALADGNYTFTFKNSGTVVRSRAFTVSPAPAAPNPIDSAREFVRQHYRDFLNREPDQAGGDFWTDNIAKCSDPARRPAAQTEAQCTQRQRETTSGAFFRSPESQDTGYYVYRMYRGALGRQPKLSEFTPDAQLVAAGIVVNGQLSAPKINQNKAEFAQQFVSCTDAAKFRCAEFKAIYDGLSNQEYVDRLFETTGVNASAADRAALVSGLNANPATETRASVLQKVVDGIVVISEGNQQFTTTYGQAFFNSELNGAFVQLEYFGYMQRDPDEAGQAFWLSKLNQFGGNFVNAEMVLAFITSPEYRARFGQP